VLEPTKWPSVYHPLVAVHPTDEFDELSTLLGTKFDPSPLPEASYALEVIEGPGVGQSFVLDGSQPSRVLVGESPACTIRLGDRQISRRHVALDLVDRRLRITDLGSTNGTFVDGVAVVDAYLRGGEIVRVGSSALRVERNQAIQGAALSRAMRFGRVIGASTEMRRLYPLCEKLATSNVPVIIEGETGTGKEVLAEALHEMGPRAAGPFVVFDCTSVPANLVESELFGHERGAFTGAVATRKGVFELAHGGTLLIDEIGDLELHLQPKLLRVVERAEVRRVGGDRPIRVDVRVIAATRRDLDQAVQAGRFRDDLFHRLAVTRIELPPLRHRRGDISMLARYFWKDLGGDEHALGGDLLLRWEADSWSGNVRELRNAVARQIALGELAGAAPPAVEPGPEEQASPGDVIDQVIRQGLALPRAREHVVEAFERRYIAHVLAQHGGDTARAAAASGIARRYFNLLRARSSR
jgi:transcriptional regulator with GAF, ATPase, and Fis domain